MSVNKNIFNFNHIDKTKTLRLNSYTNTIITFSGAINMSSTGLIVIGTVVGSVTLNPAILASISGVGLAVKTYSETKDYKRKIEMSKYAFTTYQKVLLDLRTAQRGGSFDKNNFIKELNILDDTVVDFNPLVKNNTIKNLRHLSKLTCL